MPGWVGLSVQYAPVGDQSQETGVSPWAALLGLCKERLHLN